LGADPTISNIDGWTALHWACLNGSTEIVQILLQQLKQKNNMELINKQVNLNYLDNHSKTKKWTPLHLASYGNHISIVRELLQNKADVHIKDELGMNPMHIAAKKGNQRIVEILREAGAKN
jgi:ankyrin repeat protein